MLYFALYCTLHLLKYATAFSNAFPYTEGWHGSSHAFCVQIRKNWTLTTKEMLNENNKYRLWPNLYNQSQKSRHLYGFEYAIDAIWRNQHPTNCSEAKFLVVQSTLKSGFGSEIHVLGSYLAHAMNLNRALLLHPKSAFEWQTDVPFCRHGNDNAESVVLNTECYFEPLSSCTLRDALGNDWDDSSIWALENSNADNQHLRAVGVSGLGCRNVFPTNFKRLVECFPLRTEARLYWWRAMAATYMLRPNPATLAWLHEHRHAADIKLNEPKTLRVAGYVRRADKGIEMELVDVHRYLEAAEILFGILSREMTLSESAGKPRKVLFIGAEDNSVIEEALAWGKARRAAGEDLEVVYTELFDRDSVGAKNGLDAPGHHPEEYLSMLLNLQLSTQCDAWVCTLASNWCRLMDELRVTIGGKLSAPYADLSKESCSEPPCIGAGIYDFNWRK